jgi:hypothetical protein
MLHFTAARADIASHVLSSRAMLASVKISAWSARRVDKRVTAETNAAHYAAPDAGRYNKTLLAKDALAAITSAASAARLKHYALTLPWLDDGARILPAASYDTYADSMRDLRATFDAAVADFIAAYPAFITDARHRLGAMFNADDYPAPDDIASRFAFSTRVLPMPDARDFRVDVGDAAAAAIRDDIERATVEALAGAQRDCFQRVADVVGHMAEKLAAYKPAARDGARVEGIFRDSLIANVRDLADALPALNITGDSTLSAIAERMARLCEADADTLRQSDTLRADTAARAAAILSDVESYLA